MLFRKCLFLFILLHLSNVKAYADAWTDNVVFSGFYSLDLTIADSDIGINNAVGERRSFSADEPSLNNSLVGTKLEYRFTNNISAVAQGTAHLNRDDELTADLQWAYLSLDVGGDWTIRTGKFQTPLLQGVELRNIGMTRLWARPVTPASGASGFNEYKGVDVLKRMPTASGAWRFQLSVGEPQHGLDIVDGKSLLLGSAQYERDAGWVRVGLMHAKYDYASRDGNLLQADAEIVIASAESEINLGNSTLNLGYVEGDSDATPNDSQAYVSLAYNFDSISPFVLFSRTNQHFDPIRRPPMGPPPSGGPPPPMPPPGARVRRDGDATEYNFALGMRWDLSSQYLVKSQLERIRINDKSRARLGAISADANVLSIVFEGIF